MAGDRGTVNGMLVDEHYHRWCAVAYGDLWCVLEPIQSEAAPAARQVERTVLPATFVVLTAANPGGLRLPPEENLERHSRLLQRIQGIEPWTCAPDVMPAVIGAPGATLHPDTWAYRTDAVALDISREEAAVLAEEFGQTAFHSFEHQARLVIGTGATGVELVQQIRVHIPTAL